MNEPAATNIDLIDHDGAPVNPAQGSPDVLIHGQGAWRQDKDSHDCKEHGAPERVMFGADNVLINDVMATRKGDYLIGAGPPDVLTTGAADVLIGTALMGLYAPENLKAYCQDFCQMVKDWPSLDPDARLERYKNVINAALGRAGLPPVTIYQEDFKGGQSAEFSSAWWSITVDKQLLAKSSLNKGAAKNLAQISLHEARHSEQHFMALRSRASRGLWTRVFELGYAPSDVMNKAAERPITGSSPEARYAELMENVVLGDGSSGSGRIEREVVAAKRALSADPKNKEKQAAFDKAYKAYRNLPEESDSFRSEQLTGCDGCP